MTDYLAKARSNRLIALNLRKTGADMFFPQDADDGPAENAHSDRGSLKCISKPMFVRSVTLEVQPALATPSGQDTANCRALPFLLGDEHSVAA